MQQCSGRGRYAIWQLCPDGVVEQWHEVQGADQRVTPPTTVHARPSDDQRHVCHGLIEAAENHVRRYTVSEIDRIALNSV